MLHGSSRRRARTSPRIGLAAAEGGGEHTDCTATPSPPRDAVAPAMWAPTRISGTPVKYCTYPIPPWTTAMNIHADSVSVDRSSNGPGLRRSVQANASADGDRQTARHAVDPRHRRDVEAPTADVLLAGVRAGSGDDRAGDERRPRCRCRSRQANVRSVGTIGGADATGRDSSGPARRTAISANAIDAIASRKCDCTSAGCRSVRTAIPPTTPLASTVTSTPSDGADETVAARAHPERSDRHRQASGCRSGR